MIRRFCLYGFLKNLRFFEAFLVIALRERGLEFVEIGALIAVREVVTNLLETPSGALADSWGRRGCMVASFGAYVAAYLTLGLAHNWTVLAIGMAAYGIGEAFRSGTHKALIHTWLRQNGRTGERTRVYGLTRSWSKLGSALSSLAGGAVLVSGFDYRWTILASAVPATLNMLNLAAYPAQLDDAPSESSSTDARGLLRSAVAQLAQRPRLRSLVLQSAGVEGGYTVVKDYLQPVLVVLAVNVWSRGESVDSRTVGVVAGVASFALYLAASGASRNAWRIEARCGSTDRAASVLLWLKAALYAAVAASMALDSVWPAVIGFIALAALQNVWRPLHVGRFDDQRIEHLEATVLSIESQARTATAALLAPTVGWCVDRLTDGAAPAPVSALWPAPAFGLALLGLAWIASVAPPWLGGGRAERPKAEGESRAAERDPV